MPRLRLAPLLLLAGLALAPACDDLEDSRTELGAGAEPDAEELMDGADAGGDGGAEPDSAPALLRECGLTPPCDALSLRTDFNLQAAADADFLCVLEALAAGEPGLIQTVAAFDGAVANLDFAILSPGEVLRQAHGEGQGVGQWINPPMRCTLQGPDFFAACQAAFDPSCADPERWIAACEPQETLICPGL